MSTRNHTFLVLAAILFLFIALPACADTRTIDSTHKYAWGENLGWINFAPASNGVYQGVVVGDTALSGFAWSDVYGWINFGPANSGQGVSIDASGHLSGYAWIPTLGWLSMNGVMIGSDGKWSGVAGDANTVGRVTFDCTECDVLISGSEVEAQENVQSSSGTVRAGSGGISNINATNTEATLSVNQIFDKKTDPRKLFPNDSSTSPGLSHATVTVPHGAYPEKISVTASVVNATFDVLTQTIGKVFFDIVAKDGTGKEIHSFDKPLKITLTVPDNLVGVSDLGVFWFDTTSREWNVVPNVVFSGNTATFYVTHLTRFAIMRTALAHSATSTPPVSHPVSRTAEVTALCAGLVALLYLFFRRKIRQ